MSILRSLGTNTFLLLQFASFFWDLKGESKSPGKWGSGGHPRQGRDTHKGVQETAARVRERGEEAWSEGLEVGRLRSVDDLSLCPGDGWSSPKSVVFKHKYIL